MPAANTSNISTIQILRSYANSTPTTLDDGQLAYSFVSNTLFIGSNTGVKIIGDPSTAVKSQAAYDQANTGTVLAQAAYNQANVTIGVDASQNNNIQAAWNTANASFNLANSQPLSFGWAANTILVANSAGYLSNSNAFFTSSNNTLTINNGGLTANGKIIVGNQIFNANITNVLNPSVSSGNSTIRSINLIDSQAVMKIARIGSNPSIELQQWDATLSTLQGYWEAVAVANNFYIRDRVSGSSRIRFAIDPSGNITFPTVTSTSTSNNTGAMVVPSLGVTGNINSDYVYSGGYFYKDGTPITNTANNASANTIITQDVDASQNVRLDYSNAAITIIQGTDVSQNARMTIIDGVDAGQNSRMTIADGVDASQNVRLDYSNTAITIIQGVDAGQNARMTITDGVDASQNSRLDYSNTALTIAQGVDNSQNVRIDYSNTAITIIQGTDATQNTRLTVIEGTDVSQNVRIDYSNTAITIIQGVDTSQNSRMTIADGVDASQNSRLNYSNTALTITQGVDNSQNVRIDYSNTAITIIQGVDVTQNTRLTVIEGTDASQNVRIDYSNTALTIAQGVDNSQNVRIDYSNTAITIIQGTDASQNVRLDYSNAAITIIQGTDVGQNARMTIIESVDVTQNTNIANKLSLTGALNQTVSGNVTISSDLIVAGNLIITGNINSQNVQQLTVADPLIVLGIGNYVSDTKDIGFAAHYNDGTNAHAGLFRDSGTKEFYVFQGYTPEVDAVNNIIITDPTFRTANLNASYVKGNLIATTAVVNGIDLSTYTQSTYAQANVTIGVDASQNVRIDYSNTAITIIQGVDATQNTNIAATDGKMLSAYNTANNAVANLGPVITTNSAARVIIANTTSSTSNITGALTVAGGLGVAGDLYASNGTFTTITGQTEVLKGTGTNLLLQSQALATSPWTTSNITATNNSSTAPDGSSTATLLVPSVSSAIHLAGQTISNVTNAVYTLSFYAKAAGYTSISIANTPNQYTGFDLSGVAAAAGSGWTNATITSVGSGWYRCSVTSTNNSAWGVVALYVMNTYLGTGSPYSNLYAGNGTSGVYIWGAQIEVGNTTNTYVPTTTTAIYGTPTLSFSGVAGLSLASNGSLYISPAGSSSTSVTSSLIAGSGSVNYLQVSGNTTGSSPTISSEGSDANIDLRLVSKGSSGIYFQTRGGGATRNALVVGDNGAASINYVQISSNTTGGGPTIAGVGADSVVNLNLTSKGAGSKINFSTGDSIALSLYNAGSVGYPGSYWNMSGSFSSTLAVLWSTTAVGISSSGSYGHAFYTNLYNQQQFGISHTASAVNYLNVSGNTTGNAPTITAAGSDGNIDTIISSKGTGVINLNTGAGTQVRIIDSSGTAVNRIHLQGQATGFLPVIASRGSDTDLGMSYSTQGTGPHDFYTAGTNYTQQFKVAHTASAVNYLQVTGAATGATPYFITAGSDPNIGAVYATKGSGSSSFWSQSGAALQFRITNTTSSVNYLNVTGNTTGNSPTLTALGVDSNVSMNLVTQGTSTNSSNNSINFMPAGILQAQVWNQGDGTRPLVILGGSAGGATYGGLYQAIGVLHIGTGNQPINFYTGGIKIEQQFSVARTASVVNYLQVTGATTTNSPILSAQGSDANVAINLVPKGNAAVMITGNTTGIIAVANSIYVGDRVGYANANNISVVYQSYNSSTNSLDVVFG